MLLTIIVITASMSALAFGAEPSSRATVQAAVEVGQIYPSGYWAGTGDGYSVSNGTGFGLRLSLLKSPVYARVRVTSDRVRVEWARYSFHEEYSARLTEYLLTAGFWFRANESARPWVGLGIGKAASAANREPSESRTLTVTVPVEFGVDVYVSDRAFLGFEAAVQLANARTESSRVNLATARLVFGYEW